MTDYETALRNTLTFFPSNARTVGCWFHHNQAVWKNMKRKGYLNLTNSNECTMKALIMLLALPLLLSADIQRAFDLVRIFAINHNVPMVDLFDYYQNFWLRRVGVDALSVNRLPRRTNNCVESFHNGLRMKFKVIYLNLWIFLDHLSHLNHNTHITLTQLSNNLRPTRKQTTNVIKNLKSIRDSTQDYSLGLITMWEFLSRIAHVTSAYDNQQRN
ncbi:uncharacterized protein LOC103307976 [Acyrthosiphon pisum]|uniref:MULE transposase domain-containing protein n=1 Tax=Acyrthosiphon pisum TaxID=7029 RepID=A0A8R1WYA8_ACYPI|nr:uncharacterized protein LOC103307976 [Acyrthosiphon pisum]|eukprot:XP_008178758.1 PREDICTED: uncharacterized protein LOC103307976 [Acyrthosiphon pisum]